MKIKETPLFLKTKTGNVEAILSEPENADADKFAIVCHPHSLQGGTMQNKVVTTLVKVFNSLNINTLRFNFRGVGKSEGIFDQGIGETEDLLEIIEQIKQKYSHPKISLAGFSFGSYVAFSAAKKIGPEKLVLIAPPVNHFEFSLDDFPDLACWIVQGENDEVVPNNQVSAWVKQFPTPPHYLVFPDTGHFFHAKLIPLREILIEELAKI